MNIKTHNYRLMPWLGLAVVLIATALVYWPGTHGGFLLDDYPNIADNPAMHSPALAPAALLRVAKSTHTGPTGRPLAMMSFALNAHFTGLNPQAMKRTNLAIHLLNGVLVFIFLSLLLGVYARTSPSIPLRTRRGKHSSPPSERRGSTRSVGGMSDYELDTHREQVRSHPVARYQWLALAVTAAWLLAPINLTAVLYTVQRMTSLAAIFTLAALILFVLGRSWLYRHRRRLAATVLLLLAALILTPLGVLTKESATLTLLYAFIIEVVFFRFRNGAVANAPSHAVAREREEDIPLGPPSHAKGEERGGPSQARGEDKTAWGVVAYFVVFLLVPLVLGLWWIVPHEFSTGAWVSRDFTLGERLLTEGRVIWHYIYWTLIPDTSSMTLYHDAFPVSRALFSPWWNLPAWAGIAALLAAGIACIRRWPLVALGVLWFLAGQVLTASFIPLELVYEHREYLPSLGLLLVLFSLLLLARPRELRLRRLLVGVSCLLIVLYGGALTLRSLNWSNPLVQAATAARNHPNSPRATYAYARVLSQWSQSVPRLAPRAKKALENAGNVPGQGILPESGLIILANAEDWPLDPAWFREMATKLRAGPITSESVGALNALVHCAIRKHNACRLPGDAMDVVFKAALTHHKADVKAIYGNYLLNARKNPQAAAGVFRDLLHRSPNDPRYHFSLGVCLAEAGDANGAREQLRALRKLNHYGAFDHDIETLRHLIRRKFSL